MLQGIRWCAHLGKDMYRRGWFGGVCAERCKREKQKTTHMAKQQPLTKQCNRKGDRNDLLVVGGIDSKCRFCFS